MINEPEKFKLLYNCRIEDTGQKLHKVPNTSFPMMPPHHLPPEIVVQYPSEPIVAIKMPYSEYERFLQNWNQYMDVMQVSMNNPMVREEYHRLLMLVNLLK